MGKLRLTGSLEVYNLENVSVEDAKEKVPDTLYNRAKKAIIECYDNGYEILEHQSGDILPEVLNECYNRYDKKLADAFEKYLADKIHRGDFMLEGDIEFGQMDENFGNTSIGYADIYVDTNIDIEKELEEYKETYRIQSLKDTVNELIPKINKETDTEKKTELQSVLQGEIYKIFEKDKDVLTFDQNNRLVTHIYLNCDFDKNGNFSIEFVSEKATAEKVYDALSNKDFDNLTKEDIINAFSKIEDKTIKKPNLCDKDENYKADRVIDAIDYIYKKREYNKYEKDVIKDKLKEEIGIEKYNLRELRKEILDTVAKCNSEPDVEKRKELYEGLTDKICEVLGGEGDVLRLDGDTVTNAYINWESNHGFTLVVASEDLEMLTEEYLEIVEEEPSEIQHNIIQALNNDDRRDEHWYDLGNLEPSEIDDKEVAEIYSVDENGNSYIFEDGNYIAEEITSLIVDSYENEKMAEQIKERAIEIYKDEREENDYER